MLAGFPIIRPCACLTPSTRSLPLPHPLVTSNRFCMSETSFSLYSLACCIFWIPRVGDTTRSSANSDNFYFFLSSSDFLFLLLIAMATISNTVLNKCGKSGRRLVPHLRGNVFRFSLLSVMLAVGLSYMAFIMLRYVPSIPTYWRVFIVSGGVGFHHKLFLHLLR